MAERFRHIASHPSYLPCGIYLPETDTSRTKDLNTDVMCDYCHYTICLPHFYTPHDIRARQRQHTSACKERENRLIERLLEYEIILRAAFHGPKPEPCWEMGSEALKEEGVTNERKGAQHLDVVCSSCGEIVCLVQPYTTFCDQLQEHIDRRCEKKECQSEHGQK